MKAVFLITFLLLTACAQDKSSSASCSDLSHTLLISNETYPCTNTIDLSARYEIIAIAGGDLTIEDPVAYKADLKAKIQEAKLRADEVIYFSAPVGTASGWQYQMAQEVAIEEKIPAYDLYSYSISHPWDFPNYISQVIVILSIVRARYAF